MVRTVFITGLLLKSGSDLNFKRVTLVVLKVYGTEVKLDGLVRRLVKYSLHENRELGQRELNMKVKRNQLLDMFLR